MLKVREQGMLIVRALHSWKEESEQVSIFSPWGDGWRERASPEYVKVGTSHSLAAGLVFCASGPGN